MAIKLRPGLAEVATGITDNDQFATKGYVDDAVGGEDIWDRAGTTITVKNAGDDVDYSTAGLLKSAAFDSTNIASYDAHPTFAADTDIVDKKYVDDQVGGSDFWNRVTGGTNYLIPDTAGDHLGATGARIAKGWFTNLDVAYTTTADNELTTLVTTTLGGDHNGVAGHKSDIVSFTSGSTSGNENYSYWANFTGNANDSGGEYDAFVATYIPNGGTLQRASAYTAGGSFTQAFLALSGEVNFRDYDATIRPKRLLDGAGNDLTLSGGDGLDSGATARDGGDLVLQGGSAVNAGEDGQVKFVSPLVNATDLNSADLTYPVRQRYSGGHDAVAELFDAYVEGGAVKSSSANSNYVFQKLSDSIKWLADSGKALGASIAPQPILTHDISQNGWDFEDQVIDFSTGSQTVDPTVGITTIQTLVTISGNAAGDNPITATPQITAPTYSSGQLLILQGGNSTNRITIQDGNGFTLQGGTSMTFYQSDMMILISSSNDWVEICRSTGGQVSAPSTPTSTGRQGDWAYGGGYMYRCIAADTWVRWAVATSW